ncbi:MAG: 4-alpha-glucanotransferase [Candidatus Krumholzibacteriia bacterium]
MTLDFTGPRDRTLFPRSSGVLLHPTSLPGPYGIGDIGGTARRFVDWLVDAGQSVWQMLPLGPTGYGDSPYQAMSAFAGNPLLIAPDDLLESGWLDSGDLEGAHDLPADRVDFPAVIPFKDRVLRRAWQRFQERASAEAWGEFGSWCARQAGWLDDYAVFRALQRHLQAPWTQWDEPLRLRRDDALRAAVQEQEAEIAEQRFRQWLFFEQWQRLRAYANARGVRLFGDMPIFVALESADVWVNRDQFRMDDRGEPEAVAGVPPDYFSETGQLWGNPLYAWERMAAEGYRWWGERMSASLELFDLVRIDHFRGFEAYWEVPAGAETAVAGRWVPGPGRALFDALEERCGRVPIVAEDLGLITPAVEALREEIGAPGMKVLQFAWGDPTNPYLPHSHQRNMVVYPGTHDNPTTNEWWHGELDEAARDFLRDYLGGVAGGGDGHEPSWLLIRLGMMSVAHTFVATLQDVLGLGPEGRMNTPGSDSGNWSWRASGDMFNHPARERLAHLTWLYDRVPRSREVIREDGGNVSAARVSAP